MKASILKVMGVFLLLPFFFCACRGPVANTNGDAQADRQQLVYVPVGVTPILKTNELLQIAAGALRSAKINVEGYACEGMVFDLGGTNAVPPGRWILCFRRQPHSPDMEFFIAIDERTRQAKVYR